MTPNADSAVRDWAKAFIAANGRHPTVDDLPPKLGVALGKKVFECMDYRDARNLNYDDELIYECTLWEHGVLRSRPDGADLEWAAAKYECRTWNKIKDRRCCIRDEAFRRAVDAGAPIDDIRKGRAE